MLGESQSNLLCLSDLFCGGVALKQDEHQTQMLWTIKLTFSEGSLKKRRKDQAAVITVRGKFTERRTLLLHGAFKELRDTQYAHFHGHPLSING